MDRFWQVLKYRVILEAVDAFFARIRERTDIGN